MPPAYDRGWTVSNATICSVLSVCLSVYARSSKRCISWLRLRLADTARKRHAESVKPTEQRDYTARHVAYTTVAAVWCM